MQFTYADRRDGCHRCVRCGAAIDARDGTSDPDTVVKPQLILDPDATGVSSLGGVFEPAQVLTAKSSRDLEIREEQPMRRLILALSVLGILVSAEAAKAGPSTTVRDLSASADQAAADQTAWPMRQRRKKQPSKPKIRSGSTSQGVATCSAG